MAAVTAAAIIYLAKRFLSFFHLSLLISIPLYAILSLSYTYLLYPLNLSLFLIAALSPFTFLATACLCTVKKKCGRVNGGL